MFNNYILYLVLFVLIFTLWAAYSKPNSFIDRFFEKSRGSVVIFVVIGIYITYYILQVNIEENKRNNTLKIIDKSWLGIVNKIQENYHRCPKFCSSLFFDWQKKEFIPNYRDSDGTDDWPTVLAVSIDIFQSWENVLTVSSVDETDFYVWICNFVQWAKSPQLYRAWLVLYPNYADKTVTFGNILFEEVKKNPPKNSKQLKELGFKIYNNPEIKKLIKKL